MATTTHLVTAEELMQLSGNGRYELVKGELLTMSASGSDHGLITMSLSLVLATHIKNRQLGIAYAAETGFKLEHNPDTVLAPDFAFIRHDRNPPRSSGYLEMAPDLAVEVNSSTKNRRYVERKAAQWLSFGVQSVWLVSCKNRTVEVLTAKGSRVLFTESDELIDEDVLPGFRVPLSEIFV